MSASVGLCDRRLAFLRRCRSFLATATVTTQVRQSAYRLVCLKRCLRRIVSTPPAMTTTLRGFSLAAGDAFASLRVTRLGFLPRANASFRAFPPRRELRNGDGVGDAAGKKEAGLRRLLQFRSGWHGRLSRAACPQLVYTSYPARTYHVLTLKTFEVLMINFRNKPWPQFLPMAALVRSALLSDISGSIGGTTFARARGGAYARNRTVPINPGTASQGTARSMFGSLAMAWNALSGAQRDAWNAWAQGILFTNRLGETYAPSGRQAYISCNQNLQIVGSPLIDDPPVTTVAPVLDIAWLEFAAESTAGILSTLEVTDTGPHAGDMTYQLMLSPPSIVARGQSYRNLLRGQGQFVGDYEVTQDLLGAYASTFFGSGDPTADVGQFINIGARCIDPVTGLSCAYIYTNVQVLAGT